MYFTEESKWGVSTIFVVLRHAADTQLHRPPWPQTLSLLPPYIYYVNNLHVDPQYKLLVDQEETW
jgi:hypothetical protein